MPTMEELTLMAMDYVYSKEPSENQKEHEIIINFLDYIWENKDK